MRPINEFRLQNTLDFIKGYRSRTGEYPTFRQIHQECGYSTLSLVHLDIERLKERGLLTDDGHGHIRFASSMDDEHKRYDFPFIILTDASSKMDTLLEEEKALLQAQDLYLQGKYMEALKISEDLLSSSHDQSVRFGTELTLCWCAMYTGDVEKWKSFFRSLVRYDSKSLSEKKEKELIAHFLTSSLGSGENLPKWLGEGRFYELRKEARPLANILFVANVFRENPSMSPFVLEPLCSEAAISHNDLCQVYLDLYLAMAYHYANEDKYLQEHLDAAIKTCLRRGWVTPLVEMKRSLGSPLMDALSNNEEVLKSIDELEKELRNGFSNIYKVLVEQNPTRNLSFREVEVINYVRIGLENKEIADKLFISSETVKHHLASIYQKLNVSGRRELAQLVNQVV